MRGVPRPLGEQVQSIITAVLGSTAGAIPGLAPAATLFVKSVTTGAGNAFLTLRVGVIAKLRSTWGGRRVAHGRRRHYHRE